MLLFSNKKNNSMNEKHLKENRVMEKESEKTENKEK